MLGKAKVEAAHKTNAALGRRSTETLRQQIDEASENRHSRETEANPVGRPPKSREGITQNSEQPCTELSGRGSNATIVTAGNALPPRCSITPSRGLKVANGVTKAVGGPGLSETDAGTGGTNACTNGREVWKR